MIKATFNEVLKSHEGIIYKVANSYCKNTTDRQDLIQEISIHLWKAWPKYNSDFKVSTWMYKISLNVAISFYRRTNRRQHLDIEIKDLTDKDLFDDSQHERAEEVVLLYQFIRELADLNKALILMYLDEFSYEEIADSLGITKTNVATKISRIKQDLKTRFKQEENQYGLK